jgi:predicted metal-dependent hydrolase
VTDRAFPVKAAPGPSARCADPPAPALLDAIAEFNSGKFFEQHETLEAMWIEERDPVRYFYQGILQVGVGFYHWSRRNRHGTVVKLRQGLDKLEHYRPQCMTVDVDGFIADVRAVLRTVEASATLPEFPLEGVPHIRRVSH